MRTKREEVPRPLEPHTWFLIFERSSPVWWIQHLCPGRLKHVSAVGFVAEAECWLLYSVELARTRVSAIPAAHFAEWAKIAMNEADVLKIMARNEPTRVPWLGFWCVPAIRHLVGLPCGALWPDQLWRYCLQNGAEIVSDGKPYSETGGAEAHREPGGGRGRGERGPGETGSGARGIRNRPALSVVRSDPGA